MKIEEWSEPVVPVVPPVPPKHVTLNMSEEADVLWELAGWNVTIPKFYDNSPTKEKRMYDFLNELRRQLQHNSSVRGGSFYAIR